jgi:hypothetical protein
MVSYEDRGLILAVMQEGEQVGVIKDQSDGKVAYNLFGRAERGIVNTADEAKGKVEEALS